MLLFDDDGDDCQSDFDILFDEQKNLRKLHFLSFFHITGNCKWHRLSSNFLLLNNILLSNTGIPNHSYEVKEFLYINIIVSKCSPAANEVWLLLLSDVKLLKKQHLGEYSTRLFLEKIKNLKLLKVNEKLFKLTIVSKIP